MRTMVGIAVCCWLAGTAAADDRSAAAAPAPPVPRPAASVADSGPPADVATVRILKIAAGEPCVEPRNGGDGDQSGVGRLRLVTREEALAIIDRLERHGRIVQDNRFSLLPDAATDTTARSVDRALDGDWRHTLELRTRLATRRPRPAPPAGAPAAGPCDANRVQGPASVGAHTRTADVVVRSTTQVGKQAPRVREISTGVDVTTTNALVYETAPVTIPIDRETPSKPHSWLVVITGERPEPPTAGRTRGPTVER